MANTTRTQSTLAAFEAKLNKKYGSYNFWIEAHPHKHNKDTIVFYNNVGGLYFKMGEWVNGWGYDLGDK